MMKNLIKTLLALSIVTTIISVCGFCVVTGGDTGEFLFLYNDSAETMTIDSLPKLSGENTKKESSIPLNAVSIEERGSETLYRVDAEPKMELPGIMLFSMNDSRKSFWVEDLSDNSVYGIYANKLYSDENCSVYIEENQLTKAQEKEVAEKLSTEFEKIIAHINKNFCDYSEKTTILVHDIKDEYYYNKGTSYTAGYFNPGEFGVERIIHIDIYPLMKTKTESVLTVDNAFSTLAHEFTHLVEYSVNGQNSNVRKMWFSELFALSTESAMYQEISDLKRFSNLIYDYNDVVKNGAIIDYDTYDENNGDISANYGLLYTFARYIATQYGEDVFKNILTASTDAQSGVDALLEGIGGDLTFSELLKNFYIALVFNTESGVYKLCDSDYKKIACLSYNLSGTVTLKPGAAVVIPVFNEEIETDDLNGITYSFFSRDTNVKATEVDFDHSTYSTMVSSFVEVINPKINGENITGFSGENKAAWDRVIIVPLEDGIKFGKSGSVLSEKEGTFEARCISVSDKNCYSDFVIKATEDKVHMNFITMPELDGTMAGTCKIGVNIANFDEKYISAGNIDIYIATFDDKGVLTSARKISPALINGITKAFIGRIPYKENEVGKYTVKIFAFDGGSLTPVSGKYEISGSF